MLSVRPDLSSASARHDTDEAKEQSLRGHSEKKAVAVALQLTGNREPTEPICVTKNLRVCAQLRCLAKRFDSEMFWSKMNKDQDQKISKEKDIKL